MNCKPGDLAIVIKSIVPENIGKIVKVVRFSKNDPRFGPMWILECESVRNVVGLRSLGKLPRRTDLPLHGPDDWLRPVSGLPMTDDIDTEIPA